MRVTLVILTGMFFSCSQVFAQDIPKDYFQRSNPYLNPRTNTNNLHAFPSGIVLPWNKTYLFAFFLPGTIFFRDGDTATRNLNYNIFTNEMHFINEKNDTLILADPETVNYLTIGRDKFYYDRGKYLQVVETKAGITLALQREMKEYIQDGEPPNAKSFQEDYLTTNAADYFAEERRYIRLYDNRRYAAIDVVKYYYFGDRFGDFEIASKNNMVLASERHHPGIKQFMHEHHTNFTKVQDLLDLLQFCNTLTYE